MTQRIFDIENEKDMQDLWDILPEHIIRIRDTSNAYSNKEAYNTYDSEKNNDYYITTMLKINWHDKTEITRPIYEVTGQDIGKLCAFWDDLKENSIYGILTAVRQHVSTLNIFQYQSNNADFYIHCRRLTPQEIEELC